MPESSPSSARVLLVEDDQVLQKIALRLLKSMDYSPDTANDGLEAVQMASANRYDIILMDLNMPRMSGMEAARTITRGSNPLASPGRSPVIVALTSVQVHGDFERYRAAGFSDSIAKPVQLAALKQVIEKWTANTYAQASLSVPDQILPAKVLSVPACGGPPVDLERVREMSLGDQESMRELVSHFLAQIGPKLAALNAAVNSGNATESHRLAHFCAGSSVSCGMTALATPLRELEDIARRGEMAKALALMKQTLEALDQTRRFHRKSILPSHL